MTAWFNCIRAGETEEKEERTRKDDREERGNDVRNNDATAIRDVKPYTKIGRVFITSVYLFYVANGSLRIVIILLFIMHLFVCKLYYVFICIHVWL